MILIIIILSSLSDNSEVYTKSKSGSDACFVQTVFSAF